MSERPIIARIFLWKRFSPFAYLNASQFLVTLNDSIFRLLVVFSLINKLGTDQSSNILFITGVLFVSPFLLFSMPAGELADKYSKQKVVFWTMVAEMVAMAFGVLAMQIQSVASAYAALFCVALQASVFNPAKYAILPEIVHRDNISKANGMLTLATYLAIIIGTFMVSFFTQVTKGNYTMVAIFCFIIAAIGVFTSLQISKTDAKNPTKKVNPWFFIRVYKSLKLSSKYPHLLLAVIASSYFLFTASYTQLNLIPFGIQSLGITDVQMGYVFLAAALGIGIGSVAVAVISGKNVELGISIWGAFGTTFSYFIIFFFRDSIIITVLMILSLGIHGGLYIVPLDAWVQIASPEKDRGEIVAASCFLGFVGVLIAALCIGFFSDILKISAAKGFLIIALLTLGVTTTITLLLPDFFTRFIVISFFRSFFHIHSKNQPELPFYDTSLFICPKYSFATVLTLIQIYPRISFIKFVKKKPWLLSKPFHRLMHVSPIPVNGPPEEVRSYIQKAFEKKMILCLFLEGKKGDKNPELVAKVLEDLNQPVIPLEVTTRSSREPSDGIINFLKFNPIHVEANFFQKINEKISYERAEQLFKQH